MELWRFDKQEWYEQSVSSARIIDLGAIYESSTQGFYVPRYVIEGVPERGIEPLAPDLKSVEDLPEYWEVFKDPKDPNKGLWVNCPVEWRCYKLMKVKTAAYGLDEYFNAFEPKNEAAMNAAIVDAYEGGEPVLTYYWEPTWILGKYDLIRLEEPEITTECWAEIQEAVQQDPLGTVSQVCAFPDYDIHTAVYGGLFDRAPGVVTFLKNMFVGTERLNELTAYQIDNEATPQDVAIYYLQTYEGEWTMWVPADVAEEIKAVLP
jgi:glycine betaine/proline transport system substrate-binding protein